MDLQKNTVFLLKNYRINRIKKSGLNIDKIYKFYKTLKIRKLRRITNYYNLSDEYQLKIVLLYLYNNLSRDVLPEKEQLKILYNKLRSEAWGI